MIGATFVKCGLRAATSFSRIEYPNLRKMTDAPATGCFTRQFFLSPAAARAVEERPQALLHDLIYSRNEEKLYLYRDQGKDVCVIGGRSHCMVAGPNPAFVDQTFIISPEEIDQGAKPQPVELSESYPSRQLPFDLGILKAISERELCNGLEYYRPASAPSAIYFSTCPLAVYHAFHVLTSGASQIAGRISGIRKMLDIGGGLGVISLIVSQFLSKGAIITGAEIDPVLVIMSERIRRYLSNELGYDVSPVKFNKSDVAQEAFLSMIDDADALIGWFPMNHSISNKILLSMFKRMRKGGLVFQMYRSGPLSIWDDPALTGFKSIDPGTGHSLPITVHERV